MRYPAVTFLRATYRQNVVKVESSWTRAITWLNEVLEIFPTTYPLTVMDNGRVSVSKVGRISRAHLRGFVFGVSQS